MARQQSATNARGHLSAQPIAQPRWIPQVRKNQKQEGKGDRTAKRPGSPIQHQVSQKMGSAQRTCIQPDRNGCQFEDKENNQPDEPLAYCIGELLGWKGMNY